MQHVDAKTIHLSSMTSQISFTVWTSVMNIHAFIDATGNQTATEPTSQQCYNDTRDISNHARFSFCCCIYFGMAMWTYCMSRLWSKRNNSCDYSRPSCISLRWCKWASWRNASHVLGINRRRVRWWFIRRWWSILMHGILSSTKNNKSSPTFDYHVPDDCF
jgi:hypothetical protein